ncbi:MarR family winged helix-turn-helix transcriptional regulator [Plantactinospora sonchi]|uniref:MarR family winged helix-turn-helix transcriptional regulator n=1 Tax=Plantactinospora sonchi TaxID=1544735 RepID=A0ABU7RL66_9ACTN
MTELTDSGTAFSDLLVEVFRLNGLLLGAGDELGRPAGLTSARWQVLGVIDHQPGTVADVARAMGLARQSVRQTAEALARDGLVSFAENPRHRRARLMVLTPRGRRALRDVERRQAEWANRITAGLDPATLRAATGTLRDLGQRLRTGSSGGGADPSDDGVDPPGDGVGPTDGAAGSSGDNVTGPVDRDL